MKFTPRGLTKRGSVLLKIANMYSSLPVLSTKDEFYKIYFLCTLNKNIGFQTVEFPVNQTGKKTSNEKHCNVETNVHIENRFRRCYPVVRQKRKEQNREEYRVTEDGSRKRVRKSGNRITSTTCLECLVVFSRFEGNIKQNTAGVQSSSKLT